MPKPTMLGGGAVFVATMLATSVTTEFVGTTHSLPGASGGTGERLSEGSAEVIHGEQ